MTSLALGVPLIMVTVLGLLLNVYILLVVVLAKQVPTSTVSLYLCTKNITTISSFLQEVSALSSCNTVITLSQQIFSTFINFFS
jgi:hypothetical protein